MLSRHRLVLPIHLTSFWRSIRAAHRLGIPAVCCRSHRETKHTAWEVIYEEVSEKLSPFPHIYISPPTPCNATVSLSSREGKRGHGEACDERQRRPVQASPEAPAGHRRLPFLPPGAAVPPHPPLLRLFLLRCT